MQTTLDYTFVPLLPPIVTNQRIFLLIAQKDHRLIKLSGILHRSIIFLIRNHERYMYYGDGVLRVIYGNELC